MLHITNFLPSSASRVVLVTLTGVATLCCFWLLGADVGCGAQSWPCSGLSGVGAVALVAGFGFAALLTAMLIVLGRALSLVLGGAWVLESGRRAWAVSGPLLVLHFVAFAVLGVFGALPIGWAWWHGAFGVFVPAHGGPFVVVAP